MIVYPCSALASAAVGAALRIDGSVVRAILWRPRLMRQVSTLIYELHRKN